MENGGDDGEDDEESLVTVIPPWFRSPIIAMWPSTCRPLGDNVKVLLLDANSDSATLFARLKQLDARMLGEMSSKPRAQAIIYFIWQNFFCDSSWRPPIK